jgi:glycosyltransferase involved in cell wall biosynthesis
MQPAPLTVVAGASLALSMLGALSVMKTIQSVPRLAPVVAGDRAWPRVSIIVTARDEALTIEAALRAKLADDYPNVEFIVVDDRSTDGTSEILDRLAAEDHRIVPVHITELPQGWLGKVHAMHRAQALATGEWILFSDADVHLAKGTLRAAVAHCEKHGLDHVAAFPEVWPSDPMLDASLSAMLRLLVMTARLWKLSDPDSTATIGGGSFNFVKKTMLEKIGGFDDAELDVLDDVLLGQRIKRAGGRQGAVHAVDFVGLHFYTSLGEMARGAEKNAFACHRYSIVRCVIATLFMLGIELAPFVAIAVGTEIGTMLGAASAMMRLATSFVLAKWLRRPIVSVLLGPVGGIVLTLMQARASILALWRGEIVWRDTRYSLEELRRGARFEFPF